MLSGRLSNDVNNKDLIFGISKQAFHWFFIGFILHRFENVSN